MRWPIDGLAGVARRTLLDASYGTLARDRLRQSIEDRALRDGQRLTLKAAVLKLGFVTETEFDRVVDPKKMVTRMWHP